MIRKIINALWVLLAVALIAIVVVFVSISKGWIGYMPPVEELENPNYKFATEVFSEDGKVLGTFSMEKNNRVYSSYADLYGKGGKQYYAASVAETDRMGDCRKTGTLLYERRDSDNVS